MTSYIRDHVQGEAEYGGHCPPAHPLLVIASDIPAWLGDFTVRFGPGEKFGLESSPCRLFVVDIVAHVGSPARISETEEWLDALIGPLSSCPADWIPFSVERKQATYSAVRAERGRVTGSDLECGLRVVSHWCHLTFACQHGPNVVARQRAATQADPKSFQVMRENMTAVGRVI